MSGPRNQWSRDEERFYRALGRSIKRARIAAGLKQGDLADAIGSTRPTINNIEAGRSAPSVYRLTVIMGVLGPLPEIARASMSAVACCETEAVGMEGAGHDFDCANRQAS